MSASAWVTMLCARTFGSAGLRGPRLRPFGHPPSLALRFDARALRFDLMLPRREPMLISFPQCGHFICPQNNPTVSYFHDDFQSSPLPNFPPLARRLGWSSWPTFHRWAGGGF